jgi:hypothetical protein
MAEQFVKVPNFTAKGEFASQAGSKIVNKDAILFRRSQCRLRFTRSQQRNNLFLYFDNTGKQVVTTNDSGKNALAPSDMTNIESFEVRRATLGSNVAQKQCEDLQIKQGANGNFVLTNAKERTARYNGTTQKFYDLFHNGVFVGTTNEAGYDTARGIAQD